MQQKHLLLTGRPASGKTEVLIAFANRYPATTLFLSEEMDEDKLKNDRGLDKSVKVADSTKFLDEDLARYKTICVDYLELLSIEILEKILQIVEENRLQLIVASQVRRGKNEVVGRIKDLIEKR